MTYGTDPGTGGNPQYGSRPEPPPSYGEPPRPPRRPVWWTLGALVAVAGILFGVFSCSGGSPGNPPPPPPVSYPTTTTSQPPTTPYSDVAQPYETPVGTTTGTPTPPTKVVAGSGGGADDGRGGAIGLVAMGLLLVGIASAALLRGRRHSP